MEFFCFGFVFFDVVFCVLDFFHSSQWCERMASSLPGIFLLIFAQKFKTISGLKFSIQINLWSPVFFCSVNISTQTAFLNSFVKYLKKY